MPKFRPMMSTEQKKEMEKMKEKHTDMVMESPGYYPQTITFTAEQLPEIKKWEVGKEYEITIKTKLIAYEQKKKEGKNAREEGRLEITAVASQGKGLSGEQKKIVDFMKN
jgi:hypothetical protein